MSDGLEDGEKFLSQYGLSGLTEIIAAAIIKVDQGDQEKLLRVSIEKICRSAIRAGVDPGGLIHIAMTILEISHQEVARLRREAEKERNNRKFRELAEIEEELDQEGA